MRGKGRLLAVVVLLLLLAIGAAGNAFADDSENAAKMTCSETVTVTASDGITQSENVDGRYVTYTWYDISEKLSGLTVTVWDEAGNGSEIVLSDGSLEYSESQSYENLWLPGNTYYVTIYYAELSCELPVFVSAGVSKISLQSEVTIYEGTHTATFTETVYDEENDSCTEVSYTGYSVLDALRTQSVSIFYDDGTSEERSVETLDLTEETDQSAEHLWLPGNTYEATVSYLGAGTVISVVLLENPVVSVSVSGSPFVVSGVDSETVTEWITDESGNVEGSTSVYDVENAVRRSTDLTILYTDGTEITIPASELTDLTVTVSETESGEPAWEVGTSYPVTVEYMGAAATVNVAVILKEDAPTPTVSMEKNLTLPAKAETTLTPVIRDAYDETVIWTSSDPTVAEVDENGTVTAKKYGTATVTATLTGYRISVSTEIRVLFSDVDGSSDKTASNYQYYFAPVYWAADSGITTGYDGVTFGVGENCTRAAVMIFLWRLAKCPVPEKDARTYFNDLKAYGTSTATNKAIAWAYEQGISKGYSDGSFGVKASITRKDVLIMLYRYAGKPAVSGTMKFSDCKAYQSTTDTYKAILWGSKNGITSGYSDGTFQPTANCLREQIITFISRYAAKYPNS